MEKLSAYEETREWKWTFEPYHMILKRRKGVLSKLKATNPFRDHYVQHHPDYIYQSGMLDKIHPTPVNRNCYKFNKNQVDKDTSVVDSRIHGTRHVFY